MVTLFSFMTETDWEIKIRVSVAGHRSFAYLWMV